MVTGIGLPYTNVNANSSTIYCRRRMCCVKCVVNLLRKNCSDFMLLFLFGVVKFCLFVYFSIYDCIFCFLTSHL